MREILFRGKRCDNGEWVEGYYARKGVDKDTFKHFICVMTFNVNGNTYSSMFYLTDVEVIPETVGQYTGMTDKNGKKIFDGDIIQSIESGETGEIQYFPEHTAFLIFVRCSVIDSRCYLDYLGEIKPSILKVIGNVHDNLELLQD